ncbi:hypothetical protein [Clostridium cochlearium]|uniref:hypothetical protein n=1 Tax=Clostridium cochlearium TaxID=1494 RepID=UPI001C0ED015|nr:hypothetical protein [Clostridium cochlearium]MBU5268878.1 hypothetical protein [Clostridium cochlearium]
MAINIDLSKLTSERPFNPDEVSPWKDMKRVILDLDGNEIGTLHDDDSNKWEDGTDVDWNEVESNGWNVMVRIPKFYYAKLPYSVNGSYNDGHIWLISDKPEEGFELHPAFMRCRDKLCDDLSGVAKEVDYRYRGAFLGWVDGQGRLRSLPNKSLQVKTTIGNFRNYAKANGNGWGIVDFNLHFATQLLYSVEYGNYDSQTALGRGYVDGNRDKTNTGGTLPYGNHSFGETTGKKQMSYRGIEDFWGNCRCWIDGFYCDGSRNILIGNKGFNDNGNGYKNKGLGAAGNIRGYIGNIQSKNDCGFVLSSTNGSATTKLCDYGSLAAGCLPITGGNWERGSDAGAFYFDCYYSASNTYSYIAASVAF